jgi:hypothetical protein
MAAIHFLVLPTTDEVFSWHVVETKTNQIISQHKNLRLALDKAERLNIKTARYSSAARNPGRSAPLRLPGRPLRVALGRAGHVTDIETGCMFCASHFRKVIV